VSYVAVVRRRIYSDFLMPSRLGEYRRLLESALTAGYEIASVEQYWSSTTKTLDPASRILILRHDIDTDPRTAGLMWAIERSLGVGGSHFFRLSTLDMGLMHSISEGGGRASYHYEELATLARERRPRTREQAIALIPEAQARFTSNLQKLRTRTGLAMDVVASHGDFLNRKLGVNNWAILADRELRAELGIRLETYDEDFLATVSSYHRDAPPPAPWMHADPFEAIDRREPVMYVLIHPRPWRVNVRVNARDDLARLVEGVSFRLPARGTGRPRS
jgi:hypothetical protein